MAITDRGQIDYEAGQTFNSFELMTTSNRTLYSSTFSPWSRKSGFTPVIRPYGLATGGEITPAASETNNYIDIAAMTLYMAGATGADSEGLISVSAQTDVECTRPGSGLYNINSITVNSSGAVAVVVGNNGAGFSETRNADGGPPLIPAGSVEIGQVRFSSSTAAAVTTTEIKQVRGTSQERWDYPGWTINYATGKITFDSALPAIHDDGESPTGGQAKYVYVAGYTPVYAKQPRAFDWVPATNSHSTSSAETYDGTIGSTSSTIGQASFSALLSNGTTDGIMSELDEYIWVKFRQDRNLDAYQLTNGKLGVTLSYPTSNQVQGDFTLAAEEKTVFFSS